MLVRRIIYEVQDPNGDGDWSDRTVVPLTLPPFVAEQRRSGCCPFMELIAEPSVGGEDRPDSLLLTMNTDGEQRIYRVSDLNRDGDAMDSGEFELLFSGRERAPDAVVPRVVIQDGEVVLRELVVSGLTTHTRVSRLSETGKVIDIARAFSSISEVFADSEGNIYVWAFPPDGSSARVLYKLKPVPEGAAREPEADIPVATEPAPTVQEAPTAATMTPTEEPQLGQTAAAANVPEIVYISQLFAEGGLGNIGIFVIGVDGSGPTKLIDGEHNQSFRQCPGGNRILYGSDEEVPNEQFLYVANSDGSQPAKITEEPTVFARCVSDADMLLMAGERGGEPFRFLPVDRYDVETGQKTTVLEDADWRFIWPSPDGRQLAFVGELGYDSKRDAPGEGSLQILDLDTGEVRVLEGVETNRSYNMNLQWSSDGQRLAYLVIHLGASERGGRRAIAHSLYVRDLSGGEPKLLYDGEAPRGASAPRFRFSPAGDWLLVLLRRAIFEGEGERRVHVGEEAELLLVDANSGETREVATAEVVGGLAGFYNAIPWESPWSPDEDSFIYRIGNTIYLESVDGEIRELATLPQDDPQFNLGSFGWSPDGRYFGLACTGWSFGECQGRIIGVLDTTTGEIRTLVEQQEGVWVIRPQWRQ